MVRINVAAAAPSPKRAAAIIAKTDEMAKVIIANITKSAIAATNLIQKPLKGLPEV